VAEGMRRLMEMTDADRRAMGAKGRVLVEERFTWPRVAHQIQQVYAWLCGKGTRPGFVREC
jgi:glycosyltransferase involved in cell wall biosynthesis